MKHTFNNVEFNIEGCQWWITPEIAVSVQPDIRWILGFKHIKEDGTAATVVRVCDNQVIAEGLLFENLRAIAGIRNERTVLAHRVFNTLGITDDAERKKYFKYIDYWLDRKLEPITIVSRFAKDHPKWIRPQAVPERPNANRNPYFTTTVSESTGRVYHTRSSPRSEIEQERDSPRSEIEQERDRMLLALEGYRVHTESANQIIDDQLANQQINSQRQSLAPEPTPPDRSEVGLLDWLAEE